LIPYYTKKFKEPEVELPQYEPPIFETDVENDKVKTPALCSQCGTESHDLHGSADETKVCYKCHFEQMMNPVQANEPEPHRELLIETDDDDVVDEKTQRKLDKLLKQIAKDEKSKAPSVVESIHSIEDLEAKYHRILKDDPLVYRSTRNIDFLLDLQSKTTSSTLSCTIDDILEDKLFTMFEKIKERYGCGIPDLDFLDSYEYEHYRGIWMHPRCHEIIAPNRPDKVQNVRDFRIS
jgi:hypothetical protein